MRRAGAGDRSLRPNLLGWRLHNPRLHLVHTECSRSGAPDAGQDTVPGNLVAGNIAIQSKRVSAWTSRLNGHGKCPGNVTIEISG